MATLKRFYAKKEEIPEAVLTLYVERDGGYVLDAEGHPDRAKLDEMRASNIALKKQLEESAAKFAGIDPEQVKQLAEEKRKLEEAAQLKAGEFDKVLTARVGALRSDFDKEALALRTERDSLNARLTAVLVDKGVLEAATRRGLRSTAAPDITARARGSVRVVDGAPVVFEADGVTVKTGAAGAPMTLEEWVDAQAAAAPHLFEGNAGGGAAGGGAGGAAGVGGENPFRRETWNLTKQYELQKKNPALAAQLRAAV